jgi:hypothetical protein
MDGKKKGQGNTDFTPDVRQILQEIEKEEVPQRLLELALKLQDAIRARSADTGRDVDGECR